MFIWQYGCNLRRSIQPLKKDCLHITRTTHQQNELLVQRCMAYLCIAALYKNHMHT